MFYAAKYLIPAKKETWQNSQEFCRSLGGDLVSTISKYAKWNVFRMGKAVSTMRKFWIGFSYKVKHGKFEWSDGKQSTYINWSKKKPNNRSMEKGENCVEYLMKEHGTWNDDKCSKRKNFLCKKGHGL